MGEPQKLPNLMLQAATINRLELAQYMSPYAISSDGT